MTNEPALTVDSLHTFRYKKRFSFCNRNVNDDEQNNEDDALDSSKNSEDNQFNTSKSPKKPFTLKGSAKLKKSESESDEDDQKKKKKNDKKLKIIQSQQSFFIYNY